MAAQVRDWNVELTREDVDRLSDALKDQEFRKLLSEYFEEIQDPANRARYQCEITELEKQRGVDVTFINPSPGYVIKTSVGGEKKAFINVCSNENIIKPSYSILEKDGRRGLDWQLPHSMAPPRDDFDKNRKRCVVYDVVFHPNAVRMAEKNAQFKKMLNDIACDSVESKYDVNLDRKNLKFPKLSFKGVSVPSVIRKPNPNFSEESKHEEDNSFLDELYPQHSYPYPDIKTGEVKSKKQLKKVEKVDSLYTTPKYVMKQRRDIDIKEFTYELDAKKHSAIPSSIVVEVSLPLLSSSSEAVLDVKDKKLSLISEKPTRYKLELSLPYKVDDDAGTAQFDLTKRLLIVTLPVIPEKLKMSWCHREDSGVESDSNSPCGSDEDSSRSSSLVTQLTDSACESEVFRTNSSETPVQKPDISYCLPSHTANALDGVAAFTLHVKNVDPASIVTEISDDKVINLKFNSIGAGFFSIYYALCLKFPPGFKFEKPFTEAWDNNVIMQIEFDGSRMPDRYSIGLDETSLQEQLLDIPSQPSLLDTKPDKPTEAVQPTVEVFARGNNEMNISLTVSEPEEKKKESIKQIIPKKVEEHYDSGVASSNGSSKGILKWRRAPRIGRSHSESSVEFMDYVPSAYSIDSSECIPEESSSFKKTVRFSNVIAKQTFRTNSSILGQKSKNQRKKRNKKRAQERRSSEGDPNEHTDNDENDFADDSVEQEEKKTKPSKVASDESFTEISESHQHNVTVKENMFQSFPKSKGKYPEVNFKNDLIFDLDM